MFVLSLFLLYFLVYFVGFYFQLLYAFLLWKIASVFQLLYLFSAFSFVVVLIFGFDCEVVDRLGFGGCVSDGLVCFVCDLALGLGSVFYCFLFYFSVSAGEVEIVQSYLPQVALGLGFYNSASLDSLFDFHLFVGINCGGEVVSESGDEVLLPGQFFLNNSFLFLQLLFPGKFLFLEDDLKSLRFRRGFIVPLLLEFRPPGGSQLFLFKIGFLMLLDFINIEGFVLPDLFKFSFFLLEVGKDNSFLVFILNLLIVEGVVHHTFYFLL